MNALRDPAGAWNGGTASEVPSCPFRGLRSYTGEDARFFFGRDADTDLIIGNLMASRLTVLYGPSGVGKSSVLAAGVARKLRQMSDETFGYLAVRRAVVVHQSQWTQDPLSVLGMALRAAIPPELAASGPIWPDAPLVRVAGEAEGPARGRRLPHL